MHTDDGRHLPTFNEWIAASKRPPSRTEQFMRWLSQVIARWAETGRE